MIASVDTDELVRLVWVGPLAVLVLIIAWGLVIRGTTLAGEARRDGRTLPVVLHAVVAILGGALFVTALVYGLLIMTSKG